MHGYGTDIIGGLLRRETEANTEKNRRACEIIMELEKDGKGPDDDIIETINYIMGWKAKKPVFSRVVSVPGRFVQAGNMDTVYEQGPRTIEGIIDYHTAGVIQAKASIRGPVNPCCCCCRC